MTSRVRIVDCVAHVPAGRLDLLEMAERFDTDAKFLRQKTGYTAVARMDASETASGLAEAAVRRAFEAHPGLVGRVKLLVLITQNPDGYGLPHASAILHGRLGLGDDVAAFDVSLGCSGWVYGLSIATSFMDANHIDSGLLITADPYSPVLDPDDRNTQLLFGDAAAVTVLERGAPGWSAGRFLFGTDGTAWRSLMVDEERRLRMNGHGIFVFSAKRVPACIAETLSANGIAMVDVDRVLVHQGSRYIVETIGKRLGAPDKTPFVANDVGNTVSSSIPLILSSGLCDGDGRIVVCGFGVGLSWAATVLTRIDDQQ